MHENDAKLDYLSGRLVHQEFKPRPSEVTRRAFVSALGATAAAPTAAAALRVADLLDLSVPTARLSGGVLRLRYRRFTWELVSAAFGDRAKILLRSGRSGIAIRLLRASLPGTGLRVDFQMWIGLVRGRWTCRLEIPSLRYAAQLPLGDWLAGEPLSSAAQPFRCPAGTGILQCGTSRLAVSPVNGLMLDFNARVRLDNQIKAEGSGISLILRKPGATGRSNLTSGTFATDFRVHDPAMRPRAYACAGVAATVALRPRDIESLEGDFARSTTGGLQRSVIVGPADIDIIDAGEVDTKLRLGRAACLLENGSVAVSGEVSREPFRVALPGCVAQLRGGDDIPQFRAVFRPGEDNPFEASIKVERLHLPLPDGDEAVIVARGKDATLTFDQRTGAGTNLLVEGMDVSAIRLDDTEFELSRGTDLLDLTFKFSGFALSRDWGGSYRLRRRHSHGVCEPATISLLLPPQHVTESVVPFDGGACPSVPEETTRVADPSRIVFSLPEEADRNATWRKVPLSIEALTDWSAFKNKLSVSKRATAGDGLLSQLQAMDLENIVGTANLETVLQQINETLYPPGEGKTSFQLADLFFSPGPNAEFEFPDSPVAGLVPLFGIRIGRESDPRLRVMWSKLLVPGAIPAETPDADIKRHWGIVAQTSVGGLPALRRGVPPGQSSRINGELAKVPRGSIIRPIFDKAGSYPYLLEVDRLLEEHKPNPSTSIPPETGIALTTTFDSADIEVTAFGATARLEWKGDPPIYKPTSDLGFKPTKPGVASSVAGTSLERLFFSEFLGQDETIVAADKGFLLPMGFRATLLTTQKRGYLPDPKHPGDLVATNVRIKRIITRRPVKAFPAINQPDGGRDWPASTATLLTDATPILVDAKDTPGELFDLTTRLKLAPSSIFWPQMKVGKDLRDVEWKVQVEADSTPLTARMIFIDSSVVGVDDVVRATVEIYNRDALKVSAAKPAWPIANIARLYGARRRYAEPNDNTDTSFDTDSWLLTARGRSLGGEQSFIMDARMNGADQPPFYPSVRRMKISVQSVDRLCGAPQGLIECMPDETFVKNGFTGLQQDPEIFIDVVAPKIEFSLVGVPGSTVGLAQPKSFVAALSRRSGVTGGRDLDNGGAVQGTRSLRLAAPTDSSSTELAFDFSNARANKFDPAEAFNGSFSILGINMIKLILNAAESTLDSAPKLVEQFSYGVDRAASGALEGVREVAKIAADAADAAIGTGGALETAIGKLNETMTGTNLTFEKLYPDFNNAYLAAQTTVPPSLRAVAVAADLEQLTTGATRALVAAKPFISAIETLVENPVPQAFEGVIDEFKTDWGLLQERLKNGLASFMEKLAAEVLDQLIVPALLTASAEEIQLWFGVPIASTQLSALLFDPSARAVLATAFAYEQVAVPLLSFAEVLGNLLQAFRGRVMLARLSLQQQLLGLLRDAELKIHARLDPKAPGGIAGSAQQEALARELLTAIDTALASLPPPTPPNPNSALDPAVVLPYLADLSDRFRTAFGSGIRTTLSAHPAWFTATPMDDPAAVLATFVTAAENTVLDAAAGAVGAASDAAAALVRQYAVDADRQAQLLVRTMVGTLGAATQLATTSGIARTASQLSDWCQGVNGAAATAIALGDELLGGTPDIKSGIGDLVAAVSGLPAPSVPPAPASAAKAFDDARKELLAKAGELLIAVNDLEKTRDALRQLASADACTAAASLVRSVDKAIRARNAALTPLVAIARAYERLAAASLVTGTAHAMVKGTVRDLIAGLVGDLSTVGKAGLAGDWKKVSTAAAGLQGDLGQFAAYAASLRDQLSTIESEAVAIRAELATVDTSALVAATIRVAADYAAKDKRLAALILQTVMLSNATLANLDGAALPIIVKCATALAAFDRAVAIPANKILDLVNRNPILAYLVSVAAPADLKKSIDDLTAEATQLDGVASAPSAAAAGSKAEPLLAAWRNGDIPLVRLADQLVHMVDVFLQGKFAELVGAEVRKVVEGLKAELENAITQFVPTRITTGYDWKTQLGTSEFFEIDATTPEDVGEDHLTLSSRVAYDLISSTSTADLSGRLHSFMIKLPEMATIHFAPATFTGGTGRKTSFDVKVRSVEIGDYLKFLDELKAWMSPSGNGLYVVPALDGITVGYQFSSDLITVGDIEFMNISIDVFASLPFGPGAATFGFNFASEDRPFIIACAPYGGGGYLKMEMEAGGAITGLALSFVFGAAVAFNFGILSGYGRISAGFAMIKRANGLTIQAIVEAVGEGHIACFSLSIFIRIVLEHSAEGDLDGYATYSFSFKVGFFKLHYSMTAHRHISGPGKGAAQRQFRSPASPGPGPVIVDCTSTFTIDTDAPVKSREWKKYRRQIALDLIDDI